MASVMNHTSHVRALYKAILKLHRGLPFNMQAMGDQYVKDEFRRHKKCSETEAEVFMDEWTKYYLQLAKQLAARKKHQTVGTNLSPEFLDNFNDEQVAQLVELFNTATDRKGVNSETKSS
ncbi:succinate dehydrogenase assembly factor 3, mitochondrial-like [Ruditapes philippinarum]|uniref:succinate dehydrogenase assembly factor 3, mitochondrial-like n=1 Tax=Ruditapes philippinarum TaxID=129788 RepID=UPI00295B1CC9|nr:succinate dehydrogenase assembly factor 3, mitochondrial-like [Ruditapes philippinarum]XP_060586510.1 succinate dehydrogenase assembly factor 3, mitochondrial-like [Ruditapes philippinarum]